MPTAIILPYRPEATAAELQQSAAATGAHGVRLYINPERCLAALLPAPLAGWYRMGVAVKC